MKRVQQYQSKKDNSVLAIAIRETENGVVLWNEEMQEKEVTTSTLQRWWRKTEMVEVADEAQETEESVHEEPTDDEVQEESNEEPVKAPKKERTKKEKEWSVKGNVERIIEELVESNEELAIEKINKYKSVLLVNGIRRIEFNSSRMRIRPSDAEKLGIDAEHKKYSSVFKAKVLFSASNEKELVAEINEIVAKFI